VVAGDTASPVNDANGDGSIDVIWTSPDGESAIITSFEVDGGGNNQQGGGG
jgi:hypothetical protein